MNRIDVAQFSRRAYPGAFSIEQVFHDIDAALPDDISVRVVHNRAFSRGLLPRLSDALRARRYRGKVNHVLGDVHYLTLFLPRKSTILTIHDCEMIHRASGLKRFILWLFWIRLPVARAGNARRVAGTREHSCNSRCFPISRNALSLENFVHAIWKYDEHCYARV